MIKRDGGGEYDDDVDAAFGDTQLDEARGLVATELLSERGAEARLFVVTKGGDVAGDVG